MPHAAVRPVLLVSRCSTGGTADHGWAPPALHCRQKAAWGPGRTRCLHASHLSSNLLRRASGGACAGGAGDAATDLSASPAQAPGPRPEDSSPAAGSLQAAKSSQAAGSGHPLQAAEAAASAPGAAVAAGADGVAAAGASSAPAPGTSAGSAGAVAAAEAPAGSTAATAEGAAPGAAPGPFGAALRPDSLEGAAVELASILGNAVWWYLQWHVEDLPHVLRRKRLRALRKTADTDPADPARCAPPPRARSPGMRCKQGKGSVAGDKDA